MRRNISGKVSEKIDRA